jgi:hypothetical protein
MNWPPEAAANSTVPPILVVPVENGGFAVELVFRVPKFLRVLLIVNLNVDMSNVVEAGMVNSPEDVNAPIAVFVPLVLLNVIIA